MINPGFNKSDTKLFDIAFVAFGVLYALRYSQLTYIHALDFMKYFAYLVITLSSYASVVQNFNKWSGFHRFVALALTVISLFLYIRYNSLIFFSTCILLAAYNIPFKHITRICIISIFIVLAIVLTALSLGLVEDTLFYRDVDNFEKSYAHSLGFRYYSHYAYLGIGLVVCCLYQWRKKLSVIKVLVLLVIAVIFFLLSSTRLQLYGCCLFIGGVFLLPIVPKKLLSMKMTGLFTILVYPLLCIGIYVVSKFQLLRLLGNYDVLNRSLNGRLRFNEEAFYRYGYDANLLGNDLEFETADRVGAYFYIDSGYLHALLGSGIVFTGLLMFLYSYLFYKVFKARNYVLFMFLFVYSILCIFNGLLFLLMANPVILLALSDVEVFEERPYRVGKKKEIENIWRKF